MCAFPACARALAVLGTFAAFAGAGEPARVLLVDLDARDPSAGGATWVNRGTLGSFARVGNPRADTVGGARGVFFNGTTDAYVGPRTTPEIEGDKARTIEAWVLNPAVDAQEEVIVAWGRRGAAGGSIALGYGASESSGAATHDGADLGWHGAPPPGQWHYLVYTLDGTAARVYEDGVPRSRRVLAPTTAAGQTLNLAAPNGADGAPCFVRTPGGARCAGSLWIGAVRVRAGALTAVEIARSFIAEAARYNAGAGDVRRVHDPAIAREGALYTVFSTNNGIRMRQSPDLVHWTHVGRVFEELVPAWGRERTGARAGVWAPDIAYWNGRFHLYYSVSTFGSQRSAIGLATNATLDTTSPAYAWVDRGAVIESAPGTSDFNAIDPNVVLDADGTPWLSFGSFWTGIKVTRLDPATGLRPAPGAEIHAIAARPGSNAIEAPFIVRRNDGYFLFASYDACCRGAESTYNIRVGRASAVTGPYRDHAGRDMLDGGGTLLLASCEHVRGPGHNAVVSDAAGDFLVHHFYDATDRGISHLQVRPIFWSDDEWPLVGEPYRGAFAAAADLAAALASRTWERRVSFGPPAPIVFRADGRIESATGNGTWSRAGRHLTLRWDKADAPGGAWVEACVLVPDGSYFVGRAQDDADVRAVRSGDSH